MPTALNFFIRNQGASCINKCMFNERTDRRKNTIATWEPGDTLENYKLQNSGQVNYRVDEFDYRFNSDGFRCDEFSSPADLSVLFLGCSFTEGIGLPMNEVWTSYIINNIRAKYPDKKIPYWSLALGGSSVDYASRKLVEYSDRLKPKYVIHFLSSMERREFCFGEKYIKDWIPNTSRQFHKDSVFNSVTRLFADENYATHQTYMSMLLMEQTARLHDITIFMVYRPLSGIIEQKRELLFSQFTRIKYVPWIPESIIIPEEHAHIKLRPKLARDNQHPGATWQYALAHSVWNQIQNQV